MSIELNEKVAKKAQELANSMGMTVDEAVSKIVAWYFEDCENKK